MDVDVKIVGVLGIRSDLELPSVAVCVHDLASKATGVRERGSGERVNGEPPNR